MYQGQKEKKKKQEEEKEEEGQEGKETQRQIPLFCFKMLVFDKVCRVERSITKKKKNKTKMKAQGKLIAFRLHISSLLTTA